jgi:hypothetical protein
MDATLHIVWALIALFVVVGFTALTILPGMVRERRQEAVRRQIALTDALDSALGPVVAPIVTKPLFAPWRVEIAVPLSHPVMVGRLLGIAHCSLSAGGLAPDAYRIVLVAQPEPDDAFRQPCGDLAHRPLSA